MPQMPKRVKYRKTSRGVVRGRTTRKKYAGPIKGFAYRGEVAIEELVLACERIELI